MLTKQERAKIAERLCKCDYTVIWNLYKAVTGEEVPNNTSYDDDVETICKKIIDLCDTSNMVELPRDKDGKVIHIGDTVWSDDDKGIVEVIRYSGKDLTHVRVLGTGNNVNVYWHNPRSLTHINTEDSSKLERIAQEIEEIADANKGSVTEEDLRLVAEEIRELGDDND